MTELKPRYWENVCWRNLLSVAAANIAVLLSWRNGSDWLLKTEIKPHEKTVSPHTAHIQQAHLLNQGRLLEIRQDKLFQAGKRTQDFWQAS